MKYILLVNGVWADESKNLSYIMIVMRNHLTKSHTDEICIQKVFSPTVAQLIGASRHVETFV
jgi:hypothetical protein